MDLWRDTSIILKMEAPFAAADVKNPERSECAENFLASRPIRPAYAFTMLDIARSLSPIFEIVPDLLIERKIGPWLIWATFNQASSAPVGQSVLPLGMATIAPSASWSVLEREILTRRPCSVISISATFNRTSSDRRNAPAKPRRTMARSRNPMRVRGADCAIALAIKEVAGDFRLRAVPTVLLMPFRVALTTSAAVGGSYPAV
jgi:hypothetical protein